MADGPKPWAPERREQINRKINKECTRAKARLGAGCVVLIAVFPDGEYCHIQDGGSGEMPMPFEQLYLRMAAAKQINEASGGKDVNLQ